MSAQHAPEPRGEAERKANARHEEPQLGLLGLCRVLMGAGDELARLRAEDRERIANTPAPPWGGAA